MIIFLIKIYIEKFQYHTGSIQTFIRPHNWYENFRFQYHTGSIQTFVSLLGCFFHFIISIPHWFYSNLSDQLIEELSQPISIPHWFYSNHAVGDCINLTSEFQYHTGSIQTLLPSLKTQIQINYFNTTLVLFKL